MIQKLSSLAARFLRTKGFIQEKEQTVYAFGAELLISGMLNTLGVLVLSLVFGCAVQTVGFVIAFIMLRKCAGGYHAKTHFRCFLVFLCVWAASMAAVFLTLRYLRASAMLWSYLGIAIFALVVIFLLAPVAHKNNPLNPSKRQAERRKARIILCAQICTGLILIFLIQHDLAVLIGLGIAAAFLSAALSLIAAKIAEPKPSKRI